MIARVIRGRPRRGLEEKMKRFFVMVIPILLVTTLGLAQSVDEIIQNNLKAKGGVEKIQAIKTAKVTGKIMRGTMELPMIMWYKKPNMIKMEMNFSDKTMVFAYDGNMAWQISPFTGTTEPQEMTGEMAENIKENIEFLDEPFIDYKKKGNKVELLGKEDMEGTEVFKLKLTLKSGKELFMLIDSETFIELKSTRTKKMKDGREFTYESIYGDYKPVAGVMMYHSISTIVNGMNQGEVTLELVEPNVELSDDFFKMPKKKEENKKEGTNE